MLYFTIEQRQRAQIIKLWKRPTVSAALFDWLHQTLNLNPSRFCCNLVFTFIQSTCYLFSTDPMIYIYICFSTSNRGPPLSWSVALTCCTWPSHFFLFLTASAFRAAGSPPQFLLGNSLITIWMSAIKLAKKQLLYFLNCTLCLFLYPFCVYNRASFCLYLSDESLDLGYCWLHFYPTIITKHPFRQT